MSYREQAEEILKLVNELTGHNYEILKSKEDYLVTKGKDEYYKVLIFKCSERELAYRLSAFHLGLVTMRRITKEEIKMLESALSFYKDEESD